MRPYLAAALLFAAPALAAPRVATDIGPVHSIAAQVMEGVGAPDLLIQVEASPHDYALRPSEARALQDAQIVFWIGEALTPWLERSIDNLASDAEVVELLGAGGSQVLPNRTTAIFEHRDVLNEDHDGEDHEDHAHGDDDHVKHAGEETGHNHHGHDGADPHAWLNPDNASAWADLIAGTLAKADPANAAKYAANAAAAKARIEADTEALLRRLDAVRGKQFVVFHDAYQYFERRFGAPSAGALSISNARKPSPARLTAIRAHVAENNITCIFAEPQFNAGIVTAVSEGANVKPGVMDPLGSANAPGPDFYGALLDDLAAAFVECLTE